MASKRDEDFYDDDDDEEEEEDEGDFVPGGDEEDDLDDDFEAENLDDEDAVNKEESPVLQGNLRVEGGSRIVYDDVKQGSPPYFQLVSESLPVGWSLQNPQIKEPLTFVGWILHTSNVVRFKVTTSKLDSSATVDSIEQRFLDAQAEKDSATSGSNNSKPAAAKSGDEGDLKQQASAKAPSYSLKQAPPASSSSEGKAPPAAGAIYVLQGSQIPDTPGESIRTFRGLFRAPSDTTRDSTFVTVAIQASEAGAAAGGAAKPAPAAAASAARKRGRDNEEEDDGDEGVGFQEVIDLHDDAGLSTDELRRRYYGGGGASADSNKKPKAVVAAAAIEDDDDDDDDDYGF